MATTATPHRRLAPPERRAQIVDAAARAFAAEGFAGTSMAAVAASSGVTPRIVYRHFASKEALYRAILAQEVERLGRVFAEPAGRYGLDPERLLAAGRADPASFRILWRHAAREREFHGVVAGCRAAAVECARRGLASWTPANALDWAAEAVVGNQLEAVLTWLEFGAPAEDARFARATRAALAAGVRAWSEPGPGEARWQGRTGPSPTRGTS